MGSEKQKDKQKETQYLQYNSTQDIHDTITNGQFL